MTSTPTPAQRAAHAAYLRGLNWALYETEEPSPAQVREWFDRRFGSWLPARKKVER